MDDDMRSDSGAIDDQRLCQISPDMAYEMALPKDDITPLLKHGICFVMVGDEGDVPVINADDYVTWDSFHVNNQDQVLHVWKQLSQKNDGLVILKSEADNASLFTLAAQLLIISRVLGCDLTIGLYTETVGVPGTSLSLRHALRCLFASPTNTGTSCSADGIHKLLVGVSNYLRT